MARVLGRSFFFAALLALSLPARADPLLMLMLNIAQEFASRAEAEASKPKPIILPATYPGTTVEPAVLRRLIDDSFMYLSSGQRDEVFDALNAEIMKPQNVAVRGPMIEAFTRRALEIRAAQLKLADMSYSEKQRLASEFRKEVKTLPGQDAEKLRHALEKGLMPVPSDLGQLLLAALDD